MLLKGLNARRWPSHRWSTLQFTTTTTYAPIQLPPLPPPAEPKDPREYPLLHAKFPSSIKRFHLVFPNGSRATFRDGTDGEGDLDEEEGLDNGKTRLNRQFKQGCWAGGGEPTTERKTHMPPRKKARATHLPPITTLNAAAPPSPLPSPHGSPPPQPIWPSAPPSGASSPQHQAPLQPDLALMTLLTLPSLLSHFISLPQPLQSYFLLTLLRHSPLPVLRRSDQSTGSESIMTRQALDTLEARTTVE
ncbi:uncharacterized protein F5891DRAFT_1258310 [Suillus fuscotomentosus]|uniref:Uncharacterized protein n=1 Tax=Suillus fuscotomentosus TaxID=1912939 RepID=A0AAD4HDN0_9AGAM|nr:uncharacterized protein F5891DRAFT_1258310 [Suillus fuscotomentosus]KAG1893760.1 hypothetical protein F5891DRAFT_1258310 [Suillus fuscotomentosus]